MTQEEILENRIMWLIRDIDRYLKDEKNKDEDYKIINIIKELNKRVRIIKKRKKI